MAVIRYDAFQDDAFQEDAFQITPSPVTFYLDSEIEVDDPFVRQRTCSNTSEVEVDDSFTVLYSPSYSFDGISELECDSECDFAPYPVTPTDSFGLPIMIDSLPVLIPEMEDSELSLLPDMVRGDLKETGEMIKSDSDQTPNMIGANR